MPKVFFIFNQFFGRKVILFYFISKHVIFYFYYSSSPVNEQSVHQMLHVADVCSGERRVSGRDQMSDGPVDIAEMLCRKRKAEGLVFLPLSAGGKFRKDTLVKCPRCSVFPLDRYQLDGHRHIWCDLYDL
jgi:hypothetical protein